MYQCHIQNIHIDFLTKLETNLYVMVSWTAYAQLYIVVRYFFNIIYKADMTHVQEKGHTT